jgi:hypothetical protein
VASAKRQKREDVHGEWLLSASLEAQRSGAVGAPAHAGAALPEGKVWGETVPR